MPSPPLKSIAGTWWKAMLLLALLGCQAENGFDDYRAATAAIQGQEFGLYASWKKSTREQILADTRVSPDDGDDHRKRQETARAFRLKYVDATLLDVRRAMVRRYEPAFLLLVKGNAKPLSFPPPSWDANFPDLARYKELSRLVVARAHVHRADGETERALNDLFVGMTFARRLSTVKVIDYLVGVAIQSMILREMEALVPHLSVSQLRDLSGRFERWLQEPDPFVLALAGEQRYSEMMLNEAFASSRQTGNPKEDPIAALTPAQQDALLARIRDRLRSDTKRMAQRLSGSEDGWYDRSAPLPERVDEDEEDEEGSSRIATVSDVEKVWADTATTNLSMLTSVGKIRTLYRLTALAADVERFRLENGRLPADLKEVYGGKAMDPFSGKAFVYERIEPNAYRLRSEGTAQSGELGFNFRPAKKAGKGDEVVNP